MVDLTDKSGGTCSDNISSGKLKRTIQFVDGITKDFRFFGFYAKKCLTRLYKLTGLYLSRLQITCGIGFYVIFKEES